MARLETQVNQIYLLGQETKKLSIVLYDEKLTSKIHLFLLAELRGIERKAEAQNLKKISEIVLNSFRNNKKLPNDAFFESSLAEINENLADIAHKGRKSWLGKFSCAILLKCSDQIYLANTGQVSAWLRRHKELMELFPSEQSGSHPLKTFQNFTQGKLRENDDLILTGSSIFNFVSFELLKSTLKDLSIEQACLKISKILQNSVNQDEGVGSFMLNFGKRTTEGDDLSFDEKIYTPLPESLENIIQPSKFSNLKFNFFEIINFPKKILPKLPKFNSLKALSPSAKFFLSSFLLFLLLLGLSLTVSAIRSNNNNQSQKIEDQINKFVLNINETESALIYNNQDQAFEYLKISQEEFLSLEKLDKKTAETYSQLLEDLKNKVNRTSKIENPEIILMFQQIPNHLSRAGTGFVFLSSQTETIQIFTNELKNLFMLNSTNNDIQGLAHVERLGNYVITKKALFRINESLSQFDKIQDLPDSNLLSLKSLSPNRLYALDKAQNQVLRIDFSQSGGTSIEAALKTVTDISSAVDLGVGSDIYVLFPNRIAKFSRGIEQAFDLTTLTEPLSSANKLFVGSNLYILESSKQRLIIYDKQGKLVNQIYFPESQDLKDLHVDELERNVYILDDNKLIKITF